jgi:hypothetical protein
LYFSYPVEHARHRSKKASFTLVGSLTTPK